MDKENSQRDFQKTAKETLSKGKSVLISAPTGLGKTRAAISPVTLDFKDNKKLTTRIIYTLPIRALAKGVQEEFSEFNIKSVIHTGEEPESRIFSERAIITTVDQYFTAFAGAPLSWASSASHAASGAVLMSYTVFDEVHLLSPQKGLPLLFAILKLRRRWDLPTTVMTATLPDSVIGVLTGYCGLEKIEASANDIKERDGWREVTLTLHDNELDDLSLVNFIKEKYKDGQKKVIVFVNTVDKAIIVYSKLLELSSSRQMPIKEDEILLAHSRFTKEHRKRIEDELRKRFGKDSQFDGILVTTQVAEAGLNISAPLVITELSPMDSLIQRAGRCTRFKPTSEKEKGEVIVVKPKAKEWFVPYIDSIRVKRRNRRYSVTLSEVTELVLKEHDGEPIKLNWNKERQLLNRALTDIYGFFIEGRDFVDLDEHKDLKLSGMMERFKAREGS